MVFLHIVRSLQFYLRGRFAHALMKGNEFERLRITPAHYDAAATATPAFVTKECLCLSHDVIVPIYVGLRLIDGFGHMNNASYLEAFEFGRWYHFSYTRLDKRMWYAAVYPVVSGINIQYLKEIKPFQTVNCRIRGPIIADDRTMVILQQLESKDGKTIYATATMQVAALNLPFKKPATKEARSLVVTKRGALPVEEFMTRVYYSAAERRAARIYLKEDTEDSLSAANDPVNTNSVFGIDAVRALTEVSLAWRSDTIRRSKAIRAAATVPAAN